MESQGKLEKRWSMRRKCEQVERRENIYTDNKTVLYITGVEGVNYTRQLKVEEPRGKWEGGMDKRVDGKGRGPDNVYISLSFAHKPHVEFTFS